LISVLLGCIVACVVASGRVWAQEPPPAAPETPPAGQEAPSTVEVPLEPLGFLPSPQERILAPVPQQFTWLTREVRPNPLLESLLSLRQGPPHLFMSVSLSETVSDNFARAEGGQGWDAQTGVVVSTTYHLEAARAFVSFANSFSASYQAGTG